MLTQDYATALKFLGYDPARFEQGFNNLPEIFDYVTGSEFFNRDIFLLENRNAESRVRDLKRKTYAAFLKWCEDRPDLPAFQYPENKAGWLPRIAAHFPHFQAEYDDAMRALELQREVKRRFSGKYVGDLTGLQGESLGILMKRFRASFADKDVMHRYILENPPQVLNTRIQELAATL